MSEGAGRMPSSSGVYGLKAGGTNPGDLSMFYVITKFNTIYIILSLRLRLHVSSRADSVSLHVSSRKMCGRQVYMRDNTQPHGVLPFFAPRPIHLSKWISGVGHVRR